MNESVERLGWVLVHSVWQFSLVALMAGMTVRAMRRSSAAARYGVLIGAMALMVGSPLITWLIQPNDATDFPASRGASASGLAVSSDASPGADTVRLAGRPVEGGRESESDVSASAVGWDSVPTRIGRNATVGTESQPTNVKAEIAWSERTKSALRPWLTGIVVAWSIGVLACSLRPLLGWHTLRRLKRVGVSPMSDGVLAALRRVSERLRLRHTVSVMQSTLAQVPIVVGYLRPVILLPASLMTSLPAEQLEAVLAHELAHIRRHDFLVNLLQTLVETLFFYHPAVWWLSHRIRVEREHCCDDLVVASFGNRVEYGRALLAIEELRGASTVLALGAADGSLLSRVRRIVDITPNHAAVRLSDRWPVAFVTLGCLLTIALGTFVSSRAEIETPFVEDDSNLRAGRESSDAGRGSPDPALDPTAGLPNSDKESSPPNNANGDLRSNPASKRRDSEVAYFQATPSPEDERRLVEQLRKALPEDWVVEQRFGAYWIDRRRRVFGKHFRETPDVMLHFAKELDVPETPPMEGEVSSESLGPCRFGYCMASIREDFRSEWPAIRQRIQSVLPIADPATTKSADDLATEIAVAGRLLFEDGQPVVGALVGPMFRKKSPLGGDGRFKLRVAPEWSRFRIHLLDANGWPSPRQSPRKAEHKGEVLDVMLPRTEEPFAICHLRLDRTKLHAVKLLWKGESVAARVTVQTYPSGNWLSVGQAPADGKPNLGGRQPSLSVGRTLDVMLRQGETLSIPDIAPGDGTLRIVPIKSKRTLLWNLFGDERDERLEHDPAQVGSVEFRITGAVEADAHESPLGFMLSRTMPRSGFGLGSAFYSPTDPFRLEFDPKAESYRVTNLQPGSYHVMLFPEGGTSSPPVMFTITAGQTEKIDLPMPKPARSERPKEADKDTNPTNNGDLRSNPAAGSGDPRQAPQPQSKESRALFQQWQRTARSNGNIPGGTLGPLVRVMRKFVKNNPTHEGSPKFAELLKRIEVTRDWSRDEAVKLLDEVAVIYPSLPEWVEGEKRFSLGGDVVVGKPLPDELKNAPWGEAAPNGLRVAWLLEPRALKYRLGTPLKSRILFHNAGKNSVVFRALTWNQSGEHKAHDAQGTEIHINSTYWTTIPMTFACRLAPGEFLEVLGAGIGVGANKDDEDWRDARSDVRVGAWIEAKAGDEVTFSPAAVDVAGREGPHPEGEEAETTPESWWLKFIKDRLSLDAPLPAAADERRRLLDRAVRDLFGNAPTPEEITAFTTDAAADALDALAKRLANRAGFVPFSGSLKSGTRKFLVLPPDPDAAKKPRSAKGPGQYKLGGATFVVTRRPIGERIVNEAHLSFSPTDATKPAPRQPHPVPLPDDYDSWIAAWMRGGTVLWVAQTGADKKDSIRRYDFTNPESVKETVLTELKPSEALPQAILDALLPVSNRTRAGRGSPDPALDPTAGLPKADDRQSKTDLDPEEWKSAESSFGLIKDREPLNTIEMPLYWRMLGWAEAQPFAELQRRAERDASIKGLTADPDKFRGRPVRLRLHIRRVLEHDAPKNPLGLKKCYEAWGFTDDGGSVPCVIVFADLPKGMKVGAAVDADSDFAGYLLKMMSYSATDGKKRIAPLLLGRLTSTDAQPKSDDGENKTDSENGDLRSDPAAGSGDPRRAQGEKNSGGPPELRTLRKPAVLLPDHWIVQAVGFDNGGKELVTVSNQSFITIRRWDVVGRKLISEIKLQADKHGRAVRDGTLMFSGDRRRVVAATDEYVGIWDTTTGKLLKQLPFKTKEGIYTCAIDMLDCTPDLSVIVGHRALPGRLTLSFDAHLIVWDGLSGKVLQTVIDKGATDLKAIDLSADGKRLVTTNGGGAKIWETSTGQLLRSTPNDNTGRKHSDPDVSSQYTSHVWSVQFSPDGQQLAMGDILGVKLLDATSGKLLQQLEGPYRYSSSGSPGLVFSKDGQWLARLGTQEKAEGDKHRYVVPIWSTRTGARLFELHTEANDAAFSDDGQRLAVVFSDMQQALSVWSLSGDAANVEQTAGPGPHSRQDRVEENGHYVGKVAAELIDKFQPTWGDTQLGLQYGIALTKPQRQFLGRDGVPTYKRGERVPLVVFFRNASDKPIKFDTAPDFFGNTPKILNAKGEPIALENIPLLGHIPHYHEKLAPGEALGPFYLNFGLGENPRPGQQHWHPYFKTPVAGQYKLTHSASINVAGQKDGDSPKRDQITSGQIEFEFVDAENVLRIPAGLERVVETDHRILRVNGFDPKILHLTAASPRQLLCRGDAIGTTEFTITDETQQTFRVIVKVTADDPAKADQTSLTPFRPQSGRE